MNIQHHDSKTKILDAALTAIRAKGYSAATIDDICAAASLTKGSFFHHFKSKEDLAIAASDYWSNTTAKFFETASYNKFADPLDRLLGYIDLRKSILKGPVSEFTCLVGTMVQETYDTHPAIRDACERSIRGHAAKIQTDIAQAIRERGIRPEWTAESLALHIQAVLQGAFILAKARGDSKVAAGALDHLRRYVELLFYAGNKRS
jgi:TetR/AcrR family transcriptional regulator, transcriptional repressor for nem operon